MDKKQRVEQIRARAALLQDTGTYRGVAGDEMREVRGTKNTLVADDIQFLLSYIAELEAALAAKK